MKHTLKYNKKSYAYVKEVGPTIASGDVVVLSSSKKEDVYIAKHCDRAASCPDNCAVGMRRCVHYYFECPTFIYLEKIDNTLESL